MLSPEVSYGWHFSKFLYYFACLAVELYVMEASEIFFVYALENKQNYARVFAFRILVSKYSLIYASEWYYMQLKCLLQ